MSSNYCVYLRKKKKENRKKPGRRLLIMIILKETSKKKFSETITIINWKKYIQTERLYYFITMTKKMIPLTRRNRTRRRQGR